MTNCSTTQNDPNSLMKQDSESQKTLESSTLEQLQKRLNTEWWRLAYFDGIFANFYIIVLFPLAGKLPDPRPLRIIALIGTIVGLWAMLSTVLFTLLYRPLNPRFFDCASVDEDGTVRLALCMDYRAPRVFAVCAGVASVVYLAVAIYQATR